MMPISTFTYVSEALGGRIPSLPLDLPIGIELAALVPIGFAAGLLAVLFQAMRATRHADRSTPVSRVPARSAA